MRTLTAILLVNTFLWSCGSNKPPDFSQEAKYVSNVLKLPSPDGKQALYSYWVKYPGARWGHSRFVVLSTAVTFAPSANFFSFSDSLYGFNIEGWSGDTIKTLCITPSDEPPQKLLPYKSDVTKLNNAFLAQDYYYANSFGGTTEKYFDSILYSADIVTFFGKDTSPGKTEIYRIAAKKGQVRVPLGDSVIDVDILEALTTIDGKYNGGDTIRRPPLVSLASYALRPKSKMDWKRLKNFGVFVEQPYTK